MNKKNEQLARHLANTMFMNGSLRAMCMEAEAEYEAKREYWREENRKREEKYRQSMEYKQKRAKKKANRMLRKKSQGR